MSRRPPHAAALLASPDDVEAQFYEALQQADLTRLMAVWADEEEIVCVHPGGGRVIGPAAIRASFEAIFEHNAIPVTVERVHRLHTVGSAVHHLLERITVQTEEGAQSAWVLATNVFLKTAQGWRLVAHHASPAPGPESGAEAPPGPRSESRGTLH
jgi:uncharacterized protein (TIGR02246 family)